MMQNISDWLFSTIGKGILSLLAGGITFAIGWLWRDILYPRVQNIWWQGPRLAPAYKGEFIKFDTGVVLSDHVDVKQNANKLTGTMSVAEGRFGKYDFKATLVDGVVRGTYESVADHSNTRGSFLLITQTGSSDLAGWCMEPINGKIHVYEYKWIARRD
jgi:hypothetical protein